MNPTSPLKTVMASFALSALMAVSVTGCKKDEEPPPPLPTAPAAPAPEADLQLVPEDAGTPDAAVDAGKGTGTGGGVRTGSLKKCCDALANNAKSLAPPQDGFMLQAAAICNGMAATGADRNAALGPIRGALQGIKMPAGCL